MSARRPRRNPTRDPRERRARRHRAAGHVAVAELRRRPGPGRRVSDRQTPLPHGAGRPARRPRQRVGWIVLRCFSSSHGCRSAINSAAWYSASISSSDARAWRSPTGDRAGCGRPHAGVRTASANHIQLCTSRTSRAHWTRGSGGRRSPRARRTQLVGHASSLPESSRHPRRTRPRADSLTRHRQQPGIRWSRDPGVDADPLLQAAHSGGAVRE